MKIHFMNGVKRATLARAFLLTMFIFLPIGFSGCGLDVTAEGPGIPKKNEDKPANSPQGGGGGTSTPAPALDEVKDFDCAGETCRAPGQYCLTSENYSNGAIATHECATKPTDCKSCDCLTADAKAHFPTTNNCSGTIQCRQSNSVFRVQCFLPRTIYDLR